MNHKNSGTPPSIDDLINDNAKTKNTQAGEQTEFSLDDLTLENIGQISELIETNNQPKKQDAIINLDDFDFGVDESRQTPPKENTDKDALDKKNITLQKAQNTTNKPAERTNTAQKSKNSDDIADTIETPKKSDKADNAIEAVANPTNKTSTKATQDLNQSNPTTNTPTTPPNANSQAPTVVTAPKKPLFGSKKNKPKPTLKTKTPTKGNKNPSDNKRLMLIIFGAIIALALVIVVGYFMMGDNQTEPSFTPIDTSQNTANTNIPTAELPVENNQDESLDGGLEHGDEATNPPSENAPTDISEMLSVPENIDTSAILQADIPDDPALIKEEIDRLNDIEERLAEQANDINQSLSEIDELTKAKEAQIALWEEEIALLEAQKNKQ